MADLTFRHGGDIYGFPAGKKIIDFSANINPLGLPQDIKKTIRLNLDRILHYPDINANCLKKTISDYWDVPEDNILLGNGSVELIYNLINTFRPKSATILCPTFSEYERACMTQESLIRFAKLKEENGFSSELSRLGKTEISFICNPNNPTGNLICEDPQEIKDNAKNPIVIDEAFMDFVPDERRFTLIPEAKRTKNIIVLRTLTKFFALPGLRLGYLIGHKDIISKLGKNLPPWNVNTLAQIAGELIFNDKEYINKTYKLIDKERAFLYKEICNINGLKPYPSVANFMLIKIENNLSSGTLKERLIKKNILVRDCSNFRALDGSFIRVAVRSHHENKKLIKALKEAL